MLAARSSSRSIRCSALLSVLLVSLMTSSCGDPPINEMQQAQGAIDAARAAGAGEYAKDELAAAEASLKNAQQAVDARDFRLALNFALDSRERAQNAARQAADGKAAFIELVVRTLADADTALDEGRAALRTAERARIAAARLTRARRAIAALDAAVQKARAAAGRGEYQTVAVTLAKPVADLRTITRDLAPGTAVTAPPRR